MPVILVTGFGRFPGAPINPTATLVARLERSRRPALAHLRIATHVFATRYAAVDCELPALIVRENPDAILLFGVATKAKRLRIELLARNRASVLFPDAGGAKPATTMIAGRPVLARWSILPRNACWQRLVRQGFVPPYRATPALISATTPIGARSKRRRVRTARASSHSCTSRHCA